MEKICIAKILKPQGIKGELKCKPFTDENFFQNLKEVFIHDKRFDVLSSVYRFGYFYITLNGVNSRNDAEGFRNLDIYADRSIFEEAILVSDLENCTVLDEFSNTLGKVTGVEQYGSADILNITLNSGKTCSIAVTSGLILKVLPKEKLLILNRQIFDEQKIED